MNAQRMRNETKPYYTGIPRHSHCAHSYVQVAACSPPAGDHIRKQGSFEDPDLGLGELGTLKIDDSFGLAAQLGGDWKIGERMVLNFDVRWFDIDADTYYLDPAISGSSAEKLGSLKVDPFFYALNLGFNF